MRTLILLAAVAGTAFAHGDDDNMDMGGMHNAPAVPTAAASAAGPTGTNSLIGPDGEPISYFALGTHSGALITHVVLMVVAWFFVLPVGIMLSIARSRLTIPAQLVFAAVNAAGMVLGVAFNAATPDMYPKNAHHRIGWIATCVVGVEISLSLLFAIAGRGSDQGASRTVHGHEAAAFIPVPSDEPEMPVRWSGDSGQGTEPSSVAHSRTSSLTPPWKFEHVDEHGSDEPEGSLPFRATGFLARRVPVLLSSRVLKVLNVVYIVIERTIIPLGFIAMATGAVTYGGIFRGMEVFNGLAHFIKGGIFMWYGWLTLGRWIGSFADFGWAWNVKPGPELVGWRARVPSGEFTESLVIFLYGITNVFLEHLAGWGQEWTAMDLEHVSISILFGGGGLLGMLIESRRVRDWFNAGLYHPIAGRVSPSTSTLTPPPTQRVSLNPIPAMIITMLGLMMSSHHQHSMLSTTVHVQWGMLLVGFGLARSVTYVMLALRPPISLMPYRPPSEVVAAFCLAGGGLVFMLSSRDIVNSIEYFGLDGMFCFTVGMGLTAFSMAWVVICLSLKAFFARRTPLPAPQPDAESDPAFELRERLWQTALEKRRGVAH